VLAELTSLIWSNLGTFVPLVGFVGVLVGVATAIHIRRPADDADAEWRYRDGSSDRLRLSPVASHVNVPAARQMARNLLAVAIAMPFFVLAGLVIQPGGFRGMIYEPPWYELSLPWVGAFGYLFGLGWMIRIYRADPEPDEPTWRYRC
jgi:hypothetical protein